MDGERAAGLGEAGDLRHGAGGEDERGGLADDAADAEDDARQDARHGGGEHDAEHGAQAAGAEAERALAEGIRHAHERLLSGAHDERQDHDGERHGAGDERVAPVQPGDKEQHAEQAVHDGGDAGERFGRHADDADELVAALCVLVEVDGREQAERDGEQQRERGHLDGRDDGRYHGDVLRGVMQGEQRRGEMRDAGHEDVADEEQQHREGQDRGGVDQTLFDGGGNAAADALGARVVPGNGDRSGSFSCHACFLLFRIENVRLMMRMNTNSTTPVAISASRCSPVA